MLRWFLYLFLTAGIVVFYTQYKLPNICDKPLSYKIGTIDRRFNLTHKELIESLAKAEKIWESSSNQNLFVYNSTDEKAVTVSMVFDERQESQATVYKQKQTVDSSKEEVYFQQKEYEKKVSHFQNRLDVFNSAVTEWNSSENQTDERFRQLTEEHQDLTKEAQELEQLRVSFNNSAVSFNGKVDELRNTISQFKQITSIKPEEGLYKSDTNSISIYYHSQPSELIHTIAHEFGHAIGVDHVSDAQSIMFPTTNEILQLSSFDLAALAPVCKKETLYDRILQTDWKKLMNNLSLRLNLNGIL